MELREFISESIAQVFQGVEDARAKITPDMGEIGPEVHWSHNSPSAGIQLVSRDCFPVEHIKFDVAVSVTKESGSKAKVSVLGGIIGGGVGGSSSEENSTVTRIRFAIPFKVGGKEEGDARGPVTAL